MPTKRTRRGHAQLGIGPLEQEHLELGYHLLSGSCWVCERGIEAARSAWSAHGDEILLAWPYPFPTFAEVVFDGAAWQEVNPKSDPERDIWSLIVDALEAALGERRVKGN